MLLHVNDCAHLSMTWTLEGLDPRNFTRICLFLDYTSVCSLSAVSKTLYGITNRNFIWKKLFQDKYNSLYFLFENIPSSDISWKQLLLEMRTIVQRTRMSSRYLVQVEPHSLSYDERVSANFDQQLTRIKAIWIPRVITGYSRLPHDSDVLTSLFRLKHYSWEFMRKHDYVSKRKNNVVDTYSFLPDPVLSDPMENSLVHIEQRKRSIRQGFYLKPYQVISSSSLLYRLMYCYKSKPFIESLTYSKIWNMTFYHSEFDMAIEFCDTFGGFSVSVESNARLCGKAFLKFYQDLVELLNFLMSPFFNTHPLGEYSGLLSVPQPYQHAEHLLSQYHVNYNSHFAAITDLDRLNRNKTRIRNKTHSNHDVKKSRYFDRFNSDSNETKKCRLVRSESDSMLFKRNSFIERYSKDSNFFNFTISSQPVMPPVSLFDNSCYSIPDYVDSCDLCCEMVMVSLDEVNHCADDDSSSSSSLDSLTNELIESPFKPAYFYNCTDYISSVDARDNQLRDIQDDINETWIFESDGYLRGEKIYFNPHFNTWFFNQTHLPLVFDNKIIVKAYKIINALKNNKTKKFFNPYRPPIPSSLVLYRLKCLYEKSCYNFLPKEPYSVWSAYLRNVTHDFVIHLYDYNGWFNVEIPSIDLPHAFYADVIIFLKVLLSEHFTHPCGVVAGCIA